MQDGVVGRLDPRGQDGRVEDERVDRGLVLVDAVELEPADGHRRARVGPLPRQVVGRVAGPRELEDEVPRDRPARDALADLSLLRPVCEELGERATLHVLDTADHGFKILKKSRASDEDVFVEMARVLRDWASKLVQ